MPECRKKVSLASAFLPVVSYFNPASAFRHQGSVQYCWSRISPALPSYGYDGQNVTMLLHYMDHIHMLWPDTQVTRFSIGVYKWKVPFSWIQCYWRTFFAVCPCSLRFRKTVPLSYTCHSSWRAYVPRKGLLINNTQPPLHPTTASQYIIQQTSFPPAPPPSPPSVGEGKVPTRHSMLWLGFVPVSKYREVSRNETDIFFH